MFYLTRLFKSLALTKYTDRNSIFLKGQFVTKKKKKILQHLLTRLSFQTGMVFLGAQMIPERSCDIQILPQTFEQYRKCCHKGEDYQ